MRNRKERKTDRENATPRRTSKVFVAAAVLAGGLALLPGCKTRSPSPKVPEITLNMSSSCTVEEGKVIVASDAPEVDRPLLPLVKSLTAVTGTETVREGDMALKIKIYVENSGVSSTEVWALMKVKSIDQDGVLLGRCDDSSNIHRYDPKSDSYVRDDNPDFRVEFGKTRTLAAKGFTRTASFNLKAEKGTEPGSVVLTVY